MIRTLAVATVVLAMSALPVTAAHAGPLGIFGTLENNTDYRMVMGKFNDGSPIGCTTWNRNGDANPDSYYWSDCRASWVGAHTTTGYWTDVDAFGFSDRGYYVRFGTSGSWRWIDKWGLTRIHDWHRAVCGQNSLGTVHCTVHG
jgi:hypothetical protein